MVQEDHPRVMSIVVPILGWVGWFRWWRSARRRQFIQETMCRAFFFDIILSNPSRATGKAMPGAESWQNRMHYFCSWPRIFRFPCCPTTSKSFICVDFEKVFQSSCLSTDLRGMQEFSYFILDETLCPRAKFFFLSSGIVSAKNELKKWKRNERRYAMHYTYKI